MFFAGQVVSEFERAAFEGDLDRWARGFEIKGADAELFYADRRPLPSGRTTRRASADELLSALRTRAAELTDEDICWVVLGNHGDQEGDEMGRKRGVCTIKPDEFVAAGDLATAVTGCAGVIVVVAGHCGAGQFSAMSASRSRVIVAAACGSDQFAPIRPGYLEFLLWMGIPLFGSPGERLEVLAPKLACALPDDQRGTCTLREAFDFASKNMPSRILTGEQYGGSKTGQYVQCTPVLCDPHGLADQIRL